MSKTVLALLMVVAVAGVALGSLWLSAPGDADASGHSATRSFSSSSVAPGETVTVTIRADNYGGLGRIVETLPSGFTSPDANGQTVTIRLLSAGPQTETYTVTASDNPGSYSFSGTLTDLDREERSIGGATTVTITAPPSTPDTDPSATRSFSATSVDPGEEITVTIRADNYGGLGRIVETLPSGFTSPDANGQTVTIRLLSAGPQTETYTVTASDNPGSYSFSGTLTDQDREERSIGGATTVTITAPPSTPDTDPSATRSFSATSVDPGEEITVSHPCRQLRWVGTDRGDPASRLHQPGRERPDRDDLGCCRLAPRPRLTPSPLPITLALTPSRASLRVRTRARHRLGVAFHRER